MSQGLPAAPVGGFSFRGQEKKPGSYRSEWWCVGGLKQAKRWPNTVVQWSRGEESERTGECCHSDGRSALLRGAPCDKCPGQALYFSFGPLPGDDTPTDDATLMKPAGEARSCRRPVRAELPTKCVRRFLFGVRLARRFTIGCGRAVFGCRGRW